MRQFFGGITRLGDVNPDIALGGAQLVWADLPTNCALTHKSPLIPPWNAFLSDHVESAIMLVEEFMLPGGTFVTTSRGEELGLVQNLCLERGLFLKRVFYLQMASEYWRFEDDANPEIVSYLTQSPLNLFF